MSSNDYELQCELCCAAPGARRQELLVSGGGCKENSRRHTCAVILKFFVERPDFTKSLMATKKQLSIIVNKKQRT